MFVADLHNDLVQRMMIGEDVIKNTSSGHTDIERLKLSSIDLEVMIVWASEKEPSISYFEFASKMYEKLKALENVYGVSVPITLEEIKSAKKNNQLSLPIAMEGGEALENKIENLEYFIEKGLFYFGPTWNHSLDWVSSGYGETHKKSTLKNFGLNKFGTHVIRLCQDNKVLVDGSHNPLGAKVLSNYLSNLNCNIHMILGMMNNKDHEEYVSLFKGKLASLTTIDIPNQKNSISKDELKNKINKYGFNLCSKKTFKEAITSLKLDKNDIIIITGSLYLAGEILNLN